MRGFASLGLTLSFLLAAATSTSAQWYQSRHAGDYRPYDSTPSYDAPNFGRTYRVDVLPDRAYLPGYGGSGLPGSNWPGGGYYRSPPGYDRRVPTDFVSSGRRAFWTGQYELALRNWQHALVENPDSGAVQLLIAQAHFALGQYEAASRAVQTGLLKLPQKDWGRVVKNYRHVYSNIQDYTDQIRALEDARKANPYDFAMRLVLGYHFGFLGYPKQAVAELNQALDLQPNDVGAKELREIFAAQASVPAQP